MEHVNNAAGDAGVSPQTLAHLDNLDGADKSPPGGAPGAAGQAGTPEPPAQLVAELAAYLKMARAAAAEQMSWWPKFAEVWSDSTLQAIAHAAAAVMQLHNLSNVEQFMGKFGPYVRLAMAIGMPAVVTYQALRHRTVTVPANGDQAQG